jgi:hypothetical protein
MWGGTQRRLRFEVLLADELERVIVAWMRLAGQDGAVASAVARLRRIMAAGGEGDVSQRGGWDVRCAAEVEGRSNDEVAAGKRTGWRLGKSFPSPLHSGILFETECSMALGGHGGGVVMCGIEGAVHLCRSALHHVHQETLGWWRNGRRWHMQACLCWRLAWTARRAKGWWCR